MRTRCRDYTKLLLPDVKKLETWTSQRNSAVLLIDSYLSTVEKTFMVDLIDLILGKRLPIIWALRYADFQDQRMSVVDVIRMLVLQAMQVGADHLLDSTFPVTVEQLREAASLGEWVAILNQLLSSISHAFIALDASLLAHATAHERSEVPEMLELLRLKLSSNVKIVTSTSSVSRGYAEELERSNACIKIQTGAASDWRRSRKLQWRMARLRK